MSQSLVVTLIIRGLQHFCSAREVIVGEVISSKVVEVCNLLC